MITPRVAYAGPWRIRDVRYEAGETHRQHGHDELQISIVLSGAVTEEVNGVAYRGSAGDVVVKPAMIFHADVFEATRIVCLDADPRAIDLAPRMYGWHRRGATISAAVRLAKRFFAGEDLDGAADDLVATLQEPSIAERALAIDAARMLEATFTGSVSIEAIASELGVHRVYLARVFRAQWGCSPREYLQHVRVRAAAHRLASTARPLADIAVDSGFSDQAHMSRIFGRSIGATPAQFRRLSRP